MALESAALELGLEIETLSIDVEFIVVAVVVTSVKEDETISNGLLVKRVLDSCLERGSRLTKRQDVMGWNIHNSWRRR